MITLSTLSRVTEQEVFDQVARHLLTQKRRSHAVFGRKRLCLYRSGTLKCAAGCLISDAEYGPWMENLLWGTLVSSGMAPEKHARLIGLLQEIHDNIHPNGWRKRLRILAISRGLNTEVLATEKGKQT